MQMNFYLILSMGKFLISFQFVFRLFQIISFLRLRNMDYRQSVNLFFNGNMKSTNESWELALSCSLTEISCGI